ncbi:MAG: hypothetical protein VX951_09260 [Planctomycetota bacterium]|nr:hypothetical protein [Planctomycetota bacterium]
MKKSLLALAVLTTTLLSGCQVIYGMSSDFAKISLGMTKTQVIEVLGHPVSVAADADKREESLIYKRMKHFFSEWPRTYEVVLRSGKVVRYGEQYKERNINRF